MADIIYPIKKYNYSVTIDGAAAQAGFSEVSAPDITTDPVEYREGDMTGATAGKQPGILKYSNVTLKRGVTKDYAFFAEWIKQTHTESFTRRDVTIALLDDLMQPAVSWKLSKAWPTKYSAPDFNATSNEVAIESLELVCEGIERVK